MEVENKIKNLSDSDTYTVFVNNYAEILVSYFGRNVSKMKEIMLEDVRLRNKEICF